MDEELLRQRMMEFERRRAELGLRAALPDDKRRRVWREPLTKYELHVLTFMREQGTMTAEDLAGAMAEELDEIRKTLLGLIDRESVQVISNNGFAKNKARPKEKLQESQKKYAAIKHDLGQLEVQKHG